jgi:hypothetical protein
MHIYKFILLLSLFLFTSFCNEKTEVQNLTALLETASVELSEEGKCVISLYHERGLESDKCMIDCMLNGEGINIGGGCQHICFGYTDLKWEPLPKTENCFSKNE